MVRSFVGGLELIVSLLKSEDREVSIRILIEKICCKERDIVTNQIFVNVERF